MKTNCPNCGAPIDEENHKCPYCNTPYFDMSFMNLEDKKPFYLKIKYGDMYITQYVRPLLESINYKIQSIPITKDLGNNKLYSFYNEQEMTTNISFKVIPHNGVVCAAKKENI